MEWDDGEITSSGLGKASRIGPGNGLEKASGNCLGSAYWKIAWEITQVMPREIAQVMPQELAWEKLMKLLGYRMEGRKQFNKVEI